MADPQLVFLSSRLPLLVGVQHRWTPSRQSFSSMVIPIPQNWNGLAAQFPLSTQVAISPAPPGVLTTEN